MKETTAIKKIRAMRGRYRIIQGGQGAGKTTGILIELIDLCRKYDGGKTFHVAVLRAQLSKAKRTVIKDFIGIMKSFGFWKREEWNITQSKYSFSNGAYIEFIGLDKSDIGKGFRPQVAYFNEANEGISYSVFSDIAVRAKRTYLDYNPDTEFWAHTEIMEKQKDFDYLCLTFEDNEYLLKEERDGILEYRTKGYFDIEKGEEEANIKNPFFANKWRVYGRGLVGKLEGQIFSYKKVSAIPLEAKLIGRGLDFGFSDAAQADPTALVELYLLGNNLYLEEVAYGVGMAAKTIKDIISTRAQCVTVGDSGGGGGGYRIAELINLGVKNLIKAVKDPGSIKNGIHLLQYYDIHILETSKNMVIEAQQYKYNPNTKLPIDAFNHLWDGARYVMLYYTATHTVRHAPRGGMTLPHKR